MPATIAHTGATATQQPAQQQQTASSQSSGGGFNLALPTIYSLFGVQQISWQDIGIRALLIFLGVVLVIAVAFEALAKPTVEIATKAATEGAE